MLGSQTEETRYYYHQEERGSTAYITNEDEEIENYSNTEDGLPMVPRRNDINQVLFVGEEDEEGWCRWKPLKKDMISDFRELEEKFQIKICDDIKEYFNSYWFMEFDATFKKHNVSMFAVCPDRELKAFKKRLELYKEGHDGELKYIPMGVATDYQYTIVVEIATGIIKFEDEEVRRYRKVASNLEEFILSLKPEIIY